MATVDHGRFVSWFLWGIGGFFALVIAGSIVDMKQTKARKKYLADNCTATPQFVEVLVKSGPPHTSPKRLKLTVWDCEGQATIRGISSPSNFREDSK